ncbi:MAG TPA: hypothetical protein VEB63_05250 [Chitinophagaceae bacterium]|nr:hypothetical protein [Chitinophagaceae bacterium]
MAYNDLIGTIGVAVILLAYFLNTTSMIEKNGRLYYVMNIVGAALATYAALLINYWPFVILEAAWTLVSIYGLMKLMRIKMT